MKENKKTWAKYSYWRRGYIIFACVAFGGISIFSAITLFAQQNTGAAMGNYSKSFESKEAMVVGSLVSMSGDSENEVVLANSQNKNSYLVGVVVDSGNSLMAIDSKDTNIQVAISGQVVALVSNIAGGIATGDLISQSPISGVGAKAGEGDRVLGIAQSDFNSDSESAQPRTITNTQGQEKNVYIGSIPVFIAFGLIPDDTTNNPDALQQWANKIIGKPVSPIRLSLCALIGFIGLVSVVIIVYGSIRNAIFAAGRNPLAKPVIFASLAQVMAMVALISVISVATMYLVAKI